MFVLKYLEKELLKRKFKQIVYNKCYYLENDPKIKKSEKNIIVLIPGLGKKIWGIGLLTMGVSVYISIKKGSFLPFIDSFIEKKVDILILDQNIKTSEINIKNKIKLEHNFILNHFMKITKEYKKIGIIAHSFGGFHVMNILHDLQSTEFQKVFAVAFADSVHLGYQKRGFGKVIKNEEKLKKINEIARNWVCSSKEIDTQVTLDEKNNMICLSAGTEDHPHTNYIAFTSIMNFVLEKFEN